MNVNSLSGTPKKLGVFVGGTRKDIHDARERVIDAILSAGHIPSGMELWAADFTPTLQAIHNHLSHCDLHVVLLGARYGSLIAPGSQSFTEWEYWNSKKEGRPVIAFVLGNEEFERDINAELPDCPSENDEAKKSLRKFRERVLKDSLVRTFGDDRASIERDCVNSINQAIDSGQLPPDSGWIPVKSPRGQTIYGLQQNRFIQKILEKVYQFDTLTNRVEKEADAKAAMGKAFWDLMIGRLKRHHYYNLFFESGSTLAYVSEAFEDRVRGTGGDRSEENKKWRITTNNALTLLQLILASNLETTPCPPGSPEGYYGAIFNSPLFRNPEAAPTMPRELHPIEVKAVKETAELIQTSERKNPSGKARHQIFLATASGLDLDHEQTNFRGPHIGSHPNMLFKRAMFSTRRPIVLFMAEEKLHKPFEIGKCYPVFGPDLPWIDVIRHHPLAICVGFALGHSGEEVPLKDRYHAPVGEDLPGMGPRSSSPQEEARNRKNAIVRRLRESCGADAFDYDYAYKFVPEPAGGALIVANKKFADVLHKE